MKLTITLILTTLLTIPVVTLIGFIISILLTVMFVRFCVESAFNDGVSNDKNT